MICFQQVWRWEGQYVPDDADPGPAEFWQHEYWRVAVHPMSGLQVGDWRELAAGSLLEEHDNRLFWPSFDNLLASPGEKSERAARMGDFVVLRRVRYGFICQVDGDVECGEEKDVASEPVREHWALLDEFPLVSVEVGVPLNAADPVAAARAIAAREIGLTESVRATLRLYDPKGWVARFEGQGKHTVTLETPWRAGGGVEPA